MNTPDFWKSLKDAQESYMWKYRIALKTALCHEQVCMLNN